MSLAIYTTQPSIDHTAGSRRTDEQKAAHQQAKAALTTALASGDLEASRTAFANLEALSRPDRATRQPDQPFGQMKQALADGDMDAAKAALAEMQANRAERRAENKDERKAERKAERETPPPIVTDDPIEPGTPFHLVA